MVANKNGHLPQVLATEYASYRDEIIEILAAHLSEAQSSLSRPVMLFDPMAGTAPLLPWIERMGCSAHFNDLNCLHMHVNAAKTRASFEAFSTLGEIGLLDLLTSVIGALDSCPRTPTNGWIEAPVLAVFGDAWKLAGTQVTEVAVLLRALLIISVRRYASLARTQNPTWNKPGGLRPKVAATEVFRESIQRLESYYVAAYGGYQLPERRGRVEFTCRNAAAFAPEGKVDVVMTSPPFCNRVDWDRLYAPEHYLLDSVGVPHTRSEFVGTTSVVPYLEFEHDLDFVKSRSPYVGEFLHEVKERQIRHERNSDYYVKYFTRYFSGAFRVFDSAASVLSEDAIGIYYAVQDNVHRGLSIDLGRAIGESLAAGGFEIDLVKEWDRHHLGLRNVSKQHRSVSPKQRESIWRARRRA